jgi:hypothetical protein
VPDFILHFSSGKWRVKWRTSAQWNGPYSLLSDAKAAITKALDNQRKGQS